MICLYVYIYIFYQYIYIDIIKVWSFLHEMCYTIQKSFQKGDGNPFEPPSLSICIRPARKRMHVPGCQNWRNYVRECQPWMNKPLGCWSDWSPVVHHQKINNERLFFRQPWWNHHPRFIDAGIFDLRLMSMFPIVIVSHTSTSPRRWESLRIASGNANSYSGHLAVSHVFSHTTLGSSHVNSTTTCRICDTILVVCIQCVVRCRKITCFTVLLFASIHVQCSDLLGLEN